MFRRYIPKTYCFFNAITRTSHLPDEGRLNGRETETRLAFDDRMLTNRTISAPAGSVPNGYSFSKRTKSRPLQIITFASNGSFLSSSAQNFSRDPGFRTTNVPAAPTFTTSYSLSSLARTLGRTLLCPPTLMPRRKTTRATAGIIDNRPKLC